MFPSRRLAHANLFVRDLERALCFYRDVAGLRVLRSAPGVVELGARCPGSGLTLVAADARVPLRHIRFEVASAEHVARIGDPDGIPIEFSTRRLQ